MKAPDTSGAFFNDRISAGGCIHVSERCIGCILILF